MVSKKRRNERDKIRSDITLLCPNVLKEEAQRKKERGLSLSGLKIGFEKEKPY